MVELTVVYIDMKIILQGAQRVSKILVLTRENDVHIFKLPCNVPFIIWSEVGTS